MLLASKLHYGGRNLETQVYFYGEAYVRINSS